MENYHMAEHSFGFGKIPTQQIPEIKYSNWTEINNRTQGVFMLSKIRVFDKQNLEMNAILLNNDINKAYK